MNPQRIYDQHRDDAMAKLITAGKYTTFVAMPFGERFSYRAKKVYEEVIQAAATRADKIAGASRRFDVPKRMDDFGLAAAVITEEIVVKILESHFFLADLTNQNTGVVLETGIALALKPNQNIVLITQDSHADLHFDIRNNNVINYNPPEAVESIATALVNCANAFETQSQKYLQNLSESLSPDAIVCLSWYYRRQVTDNVTGQSLHAGSAKEIFAGCNPPVPPEDSGIRFVEATRELLSRRLIRTDWKVRSVPAGDTFGMNATQLGWAFMHCLWKTNPAPPSSGP